MWCSECLLYEEEANMAISTSLAYLGSFIPKRENTPPDMAPSSRTCVYYVGHPFLISCIVGGMIGAVMHVVKPGLQMANRPTHRKIPFQNHTKMWYQIGPFGGWPYVLPKKKGFFSRTWTITHNKDVFEGEVFIWAARMGIFTSIVHGVDAALCLLTNTPFGCSMYFRGFAGALAGYTFASGKLIHGRGKVYCTVTGCIVTCIATYGQFFFMDADRKRRQDDYQTWALMEEMKRDEQSHMSKKALEVIDEFETDPMKGRTYEHDITDWLRTNVDEVLYGKIPTIRDPAGSEIGKLRASEFGNSPKHLYEIYNP